MIFYTFIRVSVSASKEWFLLMKYEWYFSLFFYSLKCDFGFDAIIYFFFTLIAVFPFINTIRVLFKFISRSMMTVIFLLLEALSIFNAVAFLACPYCICFPCMPFLCILHPLFDVIITKG